MKEKYLPATTYQYLFDICEKYGFQCEISNLDILFDNDIDFDEFKDWCDDFFKNDEQIFVDYINDTKIGIDESMSDNNWRIWQKEVKHILGNAWIYPSENRKFEINWYDEKRV